MEIVEHPVEKKSKISSISDSEQVCKQEGNYENHNMKAEYLDVVEEFIDENQVHNRKDFIGRIENNMSTHESSLQNLRKRKEEINRKECEIDSK